MADGMVALDLYLDMNLYLCLYLYLYKDDDERASLMADGMVALDWIEGKQMQPDSRPTSFERLSHQICICVFVCICVFIFV